MKIHGNRKNDDFKGNSKMMIHGNRKNDDSASGMGDLREQDQYFYEKCKDLPGNTEV